RPDQRPQPRPLYLHPTPPSTSSGSSSAGPWTGTRASVRVHDPGHAFLDQLPVSAAGKERIAHGNAERLLRL
ncbi:MAG: hypothetical protein ACJ75M_01285, partial [Actinomycetes bacterium]